MKYFIDTEFIEGTQDKTILGIKYSTTKPTIDLISIGIVAKDGREFYAISKEFNLKEAWNRYDIREPSGGERVVYPDGVKVYWIRDNVLKSIYTELHRKHIYRNLAHTKINPNPNYKDLKYLLYYYGKTNKQIAEEIKEFCSLGIIKSYGDANIRTYITYNDAVKEWLEEETKNHDDVVHYNNIPEFYGYYADYDWVVFCWLFGKMIDLPKGFPMYCKDLKQTYDEKQEWWLELTEHQRLEKCLTKKLFSTEIRLKDLSNYPKQTNEHNALADARWNKKLYEFIQKL